MSDKNKGNLALLMTAILWGTGFIAQKFGNAVMPPMTFNAVRQLMAGAVLTPLVLHSLNKSGYLDPSRSSAAETGRRRKRVILAGAFCGFFLMVGTATQQIGLLTGANDRRYGTERRGDTDFVVTSGISGWAIPFKTGTWSEYVVIDILPE